MITVKDIMSWYPCSDYNAAKIKVLVCSGVTPEQIATLKIPVDHKIWTLLHVHPDLFTEKELSLIAWDFATQVLFFIKNPDSKYINTVKVKRERVSEETIGEELTRVRYITWAAERGDARTAARYVARYTAKYAAMAIILEKQLDFILDKLRRKGRL